MMKIALAATLVALAVAGPAAAGNGKESENGNKNGWVDAPGPVGDVPPGLVVSGDNGRVDNGGGNGGEGIFLTPNLGGEDAPSDQDPN